MVTITEVKEIALTGLDVSIKRAWKGDKQIKDLALTIARAILNSPDKKISLMEFNKIRINSGIEEGKMYLLQLPNLFVNI